MGTTIELTGVGVDRQELERALAMAVDLAERWEETFSRFRPQSELSRLNAAAGEPRVVSADLLWLIERAAVAHARTGGRFDPTILPGLEAAGYDRDFELVRAGSRPAGRVATAIAPAPGMGDVLIDPARDLVRLPRGVKLDLGGIAKGAFVDRLALALMTWPGGCVDAGGDLRVWGEPPDGAHWVVGIEDPDHPETELMVVAVHDGRAAGVATSGIDRRRWLTADGDAHHLIDPTTGRPAAGEVVSCTVFAAAAIDAEIATKSLFVAATHGAPLDPIDGAAAVVTFRGGRRELVGGKAPDAITIFPLAADRPSA